MGHIQTSGNSLFIFVRDKDIRAEKKIRQQKNLQRAGVCSPEAHYTHVHTCFLHMDTHVCTRPHSGTQAREPTACTAARMESGHILSSTLSRWLPWHSQTGSAQNTRLSTVKAPSQQSPWPPPFPVVRGRSCYSLPKGKRGKQITNFIPLAQQRGLLLCTGFSSAKYGSQGSS